MKNFRRAILPLLALGLMAAWPGLAEAQRRRPPQPVVRSVVVVGGYGYAGYPLFDPRFQYGYPSPWGPYGPFGPYPYGYVRDELTSSIRLDVTPRDAEVFVDGYAAGRVDNFDGIFQRLRLRPGSHEIVLYLNGYRTIRQSLYLNPGSDQKIQYALDRLPAGEVSEAPPTPPVDTVQPPDDQPAPRRPGPRGGGPGPGARPVPPQNPSAPVGRFGTLSLRVQPGDADILVDGERWAAPSGQDRVAIQLSEGRHHVEVRKAGFSQYTEDVLIRANNTLTLNVSLLTGDAGGR